MGKKFQQGNPIFAGGVCKALIIYILYFFIRNINYTTMWKEFKAFIMQGNVVSLATAVIIGAAFGNIVSSLTNDLLMPPLGVLIGQVDFTKLVLTIQAEELNAAGEMVKEAVQIRYGAFIQTVFNFLIISAAIFLLMKSVNRLQQEKEEATPPPPPPGPTAEQLLGEIRDLLKNK